MSDQELNSVMALFPAIALSYMNIPYIYGGKTPLKGIDCSGLACELMQAIGALPPNVDYNAQGLYNHFKPRSHDSVIATASLAFYGKGLEAISHVAVFLNTFQIIEAGHGTSETKTVEQAIARDAKVRVMPYNYRKDLVAILRPKFV